MSRNGEMAEALAAVAGATLVECELLADADGDVISAQLVFVQDAEPDERLELFVGTPVFSLTRSRKTDDEGRWRTRRAGDRALSSVPPIREILDDQERDLGPGPGRDA